MEIFFNLARQCHPARERRIFSAILTAEMCCKVRTPRQAIFGQIQRVDSGGSALQAQTRSMKKQAVSSVQYVHFGCGNSAPDGWRNFDISPTLRFERIPLLGRLYSRNDWRFPENVEIGDIVSGLPIRSGTCAAVYCSHVLEHLSLEDFRIALRNTFGILRPGGVFRLVVPDLEFLARAYIDDPSNEAAHRFMRETCLGHETRSRGLRGIVLGWIGNSAHLWMWDHKAMHKELADAGFVGIRRAHLGDSHLPEFQAVENPERWKDCLGMECRRPVD